MPWRNLDATILIEQPPDVEYASGLFYVTDRVGSCIVRRCYLPHTFLKAMREAKRAVDAFHAHETVVPLERSA